MTDHAALLGSWKLVSIQLKLSDNGGSLTSTGRTRWGSACSIQAVG